MTEVDTLIALVMSTLRFDRKVYAVRRRERSADRKFKVSAVRSVFRAYRAIRTDVGIEVSPRMADKLALRATLRYFRQ